MSDDAMPRDETPTERTSSRRNLLRMVGIGAAGVAAAGVAGVVAAGPASAADTNDFDLTVASNPHATRTGTDYTGPNVASSFTVEAGPTAANNDTILNTNLANPGTASIGIANGGGPPGPGGAAPITLTNAHKAGELYADQDGTVWLCVLDGTPGTWRELGSTTSSGSFHAISPKRVYDSRTAPAGKLAAGEDRTISIATSG